MSDDVIDLRPLIRARKASDCTHPYVSVSEIEASLTCDECDAELDPWWFIRKMANDQARWDKFTSDNQKASDDVVARHTAWMAKANEDIARYNAEIQQLVSEKNRLWNEQINGRPLGAQARRARTKKV